MTDLKDMDSFSDIDDADILAKNEELCQDALWQLHQS